MGSIDDMPVFHLATLAICEREEGEPVELWMNGKGRVFVRAYNQSGHCYTHVDALDIVQALKAGGEVKDG